MQYVARRELIFGMHVHVAVDDPEKAIQVVNGAARPPAELLALSASSPFWRGEPTGLASSRQMVFSAFPRSGPPPRFSDYNDYAEVVGQLERTGCIADYTHIWWDIRLHPRLGTVEMRICDAVTRVEDAVAIAAFCQALVKRFSEQFDRGEEIPSYHRILTAENKWLAARYGLEAPVMDLATGRRNRVPVAQLIRRTLRDIEPHARELGSDRELEGIPTSSRAATAPTASCASRTRTATSSRSCARSPMQRRLRRRDSPSGRVGSARCAASSPSYSASSSSAPPLRVVPTTRSPAAEVPGCGDERRHEHRPLHDRLVHAVRPGTARPLTEAEGREDRRRGRQHAALRLRPGLRLRLPELRAAAAHRAWPEGVRLRAGRVGQASTTGTLYVETAHQTYAKSPYGQNGYVNAIDPQAAKLLWRSPALVAQRDELRPAERHGRHGLRVHGRA